MNSRFSIVILASLFCFITSCNKNVDPPQPYGAIPTESQLKWQELEYYMFIHFGPNTFTDVEWGDGKEDPKVFNPSDLDCRQWAKTAKEAGMKAIIITAKHHDGFCLWPSQYSTHTVRESLWKDGKGDILKELSEACREYGLKFGVYLSPWDQNHPAYGTADYNQTFANTLTEVLSGYGEVFEQWFDGANDGIKKQKYDWDMFHKVVYENQPQAVIFSDVGPGCRWIGNEHGSAGETNWSTMNIKGFGPGKDAPHTSILNAGQADGEAWVPGEVDVSIRPGWFYSPTTDDKVKTVDHLMEIYYASVGRNANLLLNVPPDRRGRIHPNDSTRLMEFRKATEEATGNNLLKNEPKVTTKASNTRGKNFDPSHIIDGKKDTFWATDDDVRTASIELDFGKEIEINRIALQEYIALGQRIAKFNVEYWSRDNNEWIPLTEATTIGNKRILRFPLVKTFGLRINITEALACPTLSNIEIYKAPEALTVPAILRDKAGVVTIRCQSNDPVIYYTTDGSEPTIQSTRYAGEFLFDKGGMIKAIASIGNGALNSEITGADFDIAPTNWENGSQTELEFDKIIDGNIRTVIALEKSQPLVIDLKSALTLKGFTYTPSARQNSVHLQWYNFYVSSDNKNWTKVSENATFNNIKNNPIQQRALFAKPVEARYLKLEPLNLTEPVDKYSIAEFGVITR